MKYLATTIALLLLTLSTENLHAQWVQTNGPGGGDVLCLEVSGTSIYAGTEGCGIFLSSNNGNNWVPINNGLNDSVVSIAIIGTNLFAGTDHSGIFLSTNNGNNWTPVNNGMLT